MRTEPRLPCLALDKAVSTRSYDVDGRLHVDLTPISKATVNGYVGSEIPRWRELGLDPNRWYRLLRDPEELRRAAPTFNKLPLLLRHQPVNAEQHRKDLVIGTTGDRAVYRYPFLLNTLAVWDKADGIDGVLDNSKRAISSGYRYTADMRPGTYQGMPFDGVMRDIKGNHVILTRRGRAGDDVVIGDAMPLSAVVAQVDAFLLDALTPAQLVRLDELIARINIGEAAR